MGHYLFPNVKHFPTIIANHSRGNFNWPTLPQEIKPLLGTPHLHITRLLEQHHRRPGVSPGSPPVRCVWMLAKVPLAQRNVWRPSVALPSLLLLLLLSHERLCSVNVFPPFFLSLLTYLFFFCFFFSCWRVNPAFFGLAAWWVGEVFGNCFVGDVGLHGVSSISATLRFFCCSFFPWWRGVCGEVLSSGLDKPPMLCCGSARVHSCAGMVRRSLARFWHWRAPCCRSPLVLNYFGWEERLSRLGASTWSSTIAILDNILGRSCLHCLRPLPLAIRYFWRRIAGGCDTF